MRNRIFVSTVLFILCYSESIAQDINVGIKYGVGNTDYTRQIDDLKSPDHPFNKGALVLEFSPYLSKILICSGVEYKTNDLGTFLSVPFTFRLAFRKKVRPFLEGGGYYNYALEDTEDPFVLTNDLGAKAGGGMLIHLGKRWRIEAGYYHRFGFTAALEEEIILPLGQIQVEEYKLNEGSFEFCVKYRF